MAGRGRGRGQYTFNVDALGINKGEALPPTMNKPSPLFPPMQFQPVPLQTGEAVEYMLALKQELRASTKNLPFHIVPAKPKKDVERYTDKYQTSEPKNNTIEWTPDWSRLPKELCIKVREPQKAKARPPMKRKMKVEVGKEEIIEKLETLEKKEAEGKSDEEEEDGEGNKKKKSEEDEEPEEENDYDDEDIEDETDYIMSYFDNGEDFGADSDDNMDEAIY
ncbi:DNA-directed RNA polymerase III subunit RPC7-like [Alosa pseudoharengus]|uniref:RNA polymerase III subunit GL a n=1 Tax=Alosa sapidissima TaxID=34773 RepID=UPI001C0A27EF|nr:RNA polymerase III subunit GL a [Alosa sapidissima]XP_041933303.1 RNA polymerase III subunit GL a [Alosa sapidissima]